jgi:hypothetical protein
LLHLRPERQAALPRCPEEGLLAEAVAAQEKTVTLLVVDRQRPHPVETREGVCAPLEERRQQHFAIAARREAPAQRGEFGAHFDVVVDLAVEDHRGATRNDDRLVTGRREVEDCQTSEAERDAARSGRRVEEFFGRPSLRCLRSPQSRAVWTAVSSRVNRVGEPGARNAWFAGEISSDAANDGHLRSMTPPGRTVS